MTDSQMERSIIRMVGAILAPHGFELEALHETFVRPTAFGRQGISFRTVAGNGTAGFYPFIRVDEAEQIANRFDITSPKYHSVTRTITTTLDYVANAHVGKLQVYDIPELELEVGKLFHKYLKPTLAFFDSYDDPRAIQRDINKSTSLGIPLDGHNQLRHALRDLTLTWLYRPEDFEACQARYFHPRVAAVLGDDMQRLRQLTDYLETNMYA